jgi:hypothetical protein
MSTKPTGETPVSAEVHSLSFLIGNALKNHIQLVFAEPVARVSHMELIQQIAEYVEALVPTLEPVKQMGVDGAAREQQGYLKGLQMAKSSCAKCNCRK